MMKNKVRLFRSLRTQLPLSYIGIALLTTSMIGVVMLFTIGNYYSDLEKQYLDANIHGTANNLSRIAESFEIEQTDSLADFSDVFQNQVKVTAFLIQSRVRIMDTEGNVIADSGSPSRSWNITMSRPRPSEDQQPPEQEEDTVSMGAESSESDPAQSSFSLEPSNDNKPQQNRNLPAYSIQANPNMFGYQLLQDATNEYDNRSLIVEEAPFYDAEDNILGYVELSESPEYGRRIINDVLRVWGIASIAGVIVATLFGYLMSRSLTNPLVKLEKVASTMKEGNYEIRSPILQPDEMASFSETFNQMAAHIQHSIETLRHFVTDAAHEIRTPLTSLRADLSLVLSENSTKKNKPIIQRSLEQVERLDQLSRDLLDLSKLESRDKCNEWAIFDLKNLLLEITEVHASAAEQAEIDFQVQLPKDKVFIKGDALQIQRAVSNLLNNAVKFTSRGGYISLNLYTESQSAMILVEDNGIGIPASEREKIFNRFHRGKNTQNYPGSGLGLAISKAIVVNHNGDIGILPNNKKTTFFIRLPLYEKKE